MPHLPPPETEPASTAGVRIAPAALAAFAASARVLAEKPGRAVSRGPLELEGRIIDAVVKVRARRGLRDRLLPSRTPFARHRRGAALLAEAGFATPAVRTHAVYRPRRGGAVELLAMDAAEGPTLLEVMAGRAPRGVQGEHALARAVGGLVRRLSDCRLHSKDLKPSNLVVAADGGLVILDCDTVGRPPRGHPLLPLVLEPLGCGVLPRRALLARAVTACCRTRAERRAAWRSIAHAVRTHGDPTPRDNPLAAGPR